MPQPRAYQCADEDVDEDFVYFKVGFALAHINAQKNAIGQQKPGGKHQPIPARRKRSDAKKLGRHIPVYDSKVDHRPKMRDLRS